MKRLLTGRLFVAIILVAASCTNDGSEPSPRESRSSVQTDLEPIRVNYFEVIDENWLELALDYCGRDYRLEVQETVERVNVLVEAPPPGDVVNDCGTTATVILDEPLGDRFVINTGPGGAISQINP